MSNGVKYFVTFALGAAVGSVAAWSFLKSKYEQLAKEEIEEVREYYRGKEEESTGEEEPATDELTVAEYVALTETYTEQEGGSKDMSKAEDTPYVITPEEFAADDEYQSESLTYYACGTLTDDFDNPIEDIPAMVGDALEHFGEYEDDSVFVGNDRYKCNYEILKDVRTYADVQSRIMNLTEDDE
jgi:hypothetical protein